MSHFAVGREGQIYFAAVDGDGNLAKTTVRVLRQDGTLDVVVGGGAVPNSGDVLASEVSLGSGTIQDMAVGFDGTLYYVMLDGFSATRVQRVSTAGWLSTLLLDKLPDSALTKSFSGEHDPQGMPTNIGIDLQGNLVVAEAQKRRILRVAPGLASQHFLAPSSAGTITRPNSECTSYDPQRHACVSPSSTPDGYAWQLAAYTVNSEDRSEVYYFNDNGQHVATTDVVTGTPKILFKYGTSGLLDEVIYNGQHLAVTRSGDSVQIGPMLLEDIENEHARTIAPVAGATSIPTTARWAMDYTEGGLLLKFWDPRANRAGMRLGNPTSFVWDELSTNPGRASISMLGTDTDALGASQRLSSDIGQPQFQPSGSVYWCGERVVTSWSIAAQTSKVMHDSAEGRQTKYATSYVASGLRASTSDAVVRSLRTASRVLPSGERTSWTDPAGDRSESITAPGVSRTITHPAATDTTTPTFRTEVTTTIEAASDGATPSVVRPELTYTLSTRRIEEQALPGGQGLLNRLTETTTLTANGMRSRTLTRVRDSSTSTTTVTSPAGRVSVMSFDEHDRVARISSPGSATTTFMYGRALDGSSRLLEVARKTADGSRFVSFGYESASLYPSSRYASVSSSENAVTAFGPRVFGSPQTVQNGALPALSLSFDESGQSTGVTTGSGQRHGLGIDALGRVTSYAAPGWTATESPATCPLGTRCFVYTADRKPKSIRLEDGADVVFTYDEEQPVKDGLLHTITTPGAATASFGYDGSGRLSTASASSGGTVEFAYQASLPIRETWSGTVSALDGSQTVWSGPLQGEVKRSYNAFAELDTVQVVGGYQARYTRDLDGLVTRVVQGDGDDTVPPLLTPRSAVDGRITDTTQGMVKTTIDYGRDNAGLTFGEWQSMTARVSNTQVFRSSYEYDDAGRIARWADASLGFTRTHRYDYDDAGRLEVIRDDAGNELTRYTYDANGNRITEQTASGTIRSACGLNGAANASDQLCTVGDRAYSYDSHGMLATVSSPLGERHFTYDGLGGLQKAISASGDTIHYVHDALGRRIARVVNGQRDKSWIYANGLSPIAQYNAAGDLEATFVYATRANVPDFVVENVGSAVVTYRVIADHLGTPRRLLRTSDGAVVHELDVDEWGRVLRDTGAKRGLLPFGFAGGLWDRDTGLVRFGARDYDAETGRWTARDPILFAGGQANLYAYAHNDPINFIDLTGLNAGSCFLKGLAAGAVGAVAVGLAAAAAATVLPVAVVTGALIAGAAYGSASVAWDVTANAIDKNWDRVAYDAGALVGGIAAGVPTGRLTAEAINGVKSPPWSWGSDASQGYQSGLGSFGDWLGTGLNPGSAGATTAFSGANGAVGAGSSVCGGGCD